MRKSNTNAIFLFLILLFFIISFASASFSIGKGNMTLKTYSPGAYLIGYLNISFQNQSINGILRDNQGNTINLTELLNSSRNKGYNFTCDVIDCEKNYQSKDKLSSKTYSLTSGEEILFGLEFKGILEKINSVKFTIDSNAGEACESQFKIDILNNEIYDYSNTKTSSLVCSGAYTGCYNASIREDIELLITNTPLCQKMNLSEASGYQIGAWIAEKTSGASSIKMSLYDKIGLKITGCDILKAGMSASGGELYCNISYLNPKIDEYYVCLYSEGNGGEYKTKGYSLIKGCGFSGLPPKNGSAAYYIFAKPKKFGAVGSLNIGDNLTNEQNISTLAEDYIYSTYGTNDCTNGCYVPIKIKANVAQEITIKNFSIKYDQENLPGIEDKKFSTLEEVSAKINSKPQYLFLDGLFKLPTKVGNLSYYLYLDEDKLMNENLQIKNVSMSLSPLRVPIAETTTFKINVISDNIPVEYTWVFEDATKITLTNQVNYIYLKEGYHEILVGVETKDGGLFAKTFNISVKSAKETGNETLTELEKNLKQINNQIINLDSFTKSKIIEDLNLTFVENKISSLRLQFNKADNESDYIEIINELNSISLPEAIIQTSTNYISYYPEKIDIDLYALAAITGEDYDGENSSGYKDAILYWNQLTLDTKISMKEFSYKYGSELIPFLKTFNLQFAPKEYLENNTYLIIGNLEDLQFSKNISQKGEYSYIKINGESSISFSTTENVNFIGLPLFISPAIENLPALIANPPGQYKNNWWILVILFASVIIIAFAVYLILHKWYDKRYEDSLFPNKNNLYNLITYINNQKAKGFSEEQIQESLRKAKWSSERIRYVIRKYLGKNTGMWEPVQIKTEKIEFAKSGEVKKRNIFWHIALGIITAGIYWAIWFFISSHELRKITKKAPKFILIFIPLVLSCLFLVIIKFSEFFLKFINETTLEIVIVALLILGLVFMIIAFIKYSKALKEITGFSSVGTFLLLLIVYPIGAIVSQVQLNKKSKSLAKS